jgi:hypothetical protein
LKEVIRYKPVTIARDWAVANTKNLGIETESFLFEMSNGLSANGVWLKSTTSPETAPATILLDDNGKSYASLEVSDRVNRGEQVLALDLIFTGDAWAGSNPYLYEENLQGLGDRALGIEVAQLIEIARWLQRRSPAAKVRLESTGMRNQVVGEIAAALEPKLFSEVVITEGIGTLGYLLEAPVPFQKAPELFCLDLYKEFDLDRFAAMAAPNRVRVENLVEVPKKTEATNSSE